MSVADHVIYYLGWKWGTRLGVRFDEELSDDYPALVVRGEGVCLVSFTPELDDGESDLLEEAAGTLSDHVDAAELDDFLFGKEAPTAYETAYMLVPGPGGVKFKPGPGQVRFDPPRKDVDVFTEALPERDWLAGGIAPFARGCAVYEGKRIVALAGGRLQSGVLDLSFVTLPAARGKGYGAAALSAMIAAYPEAIPLWRVEAENKASLACAEAMGFETLFTQEGIILLDED